LAFIVIDITKKGGRVPRGQLVRSLLLAVSSSNHPKDVPQKSHAASIAFDSVDCKFAPSQRFCFVRAFLALSTASCLGWARWLLASAASNYSLH